MNTKINKKALGMLFLLCSTVIFMALLWNIDISVSAKMLSNCGVDANMEGLFFTNVNPRIMYHLDLMLLTALWLIMCLAFIAGAIYNEKKH